MEGWTGSNGEIGSSEGTTCLLTERVWHSASLGVLTSPARLTRDLDISAGSVGVMAASLARDKRTWLSSTALAAAASS